MSRLKSSVVIHSDDDGASYVTVEEALGNLRGGALKLVAEYNTGLAGETVSTIVIATAAPGTLVPIFRIILDVEEGDVLFVAGNAGFTHTLSYNVSVYIALLLSDFETLSDGQLITPVSGITVVDTAGDQHLTFTKSGSARMTETGLVYVGLSAYAASSASPGTDLLTVNYGYGNLSILHYRPIVSDALYTANAVSFDGTNDYLTRGGGLSGAVDGKKITISAWVKKNTDSVLQIIQGSDRITLGGGGANALRMFINTTDNVFVLANDTGGTGILQISSTASSVLASSGWVHILFSCDLSDTAKRHLYIDDISDLATVTTYTNSDMDLTIADWSVGARPSGADKLNGDVADLWVSSEYVDFSVTANRRKFIDSLGAPVDLGPTGTKPTGTMPLLYLSRDTSNWHINRGKGGGMTLTGALTTASSSPSD